MSPFEKEGKDLADRVSRFINSGTFQGQKAFIHHMSRDHRTLQQGFTRLCVEWIKAQSKAKHDQRNQASVELCKEIVETIGEDSFFLPLI